jgi:hypothetical protein
MAMLQLVSKIINRIKTNSDYQYDDESNTITFTGMMVYHIERRGFFSIEDDEGNSYFPINAKDFPKMLKDRLRVRFTLRCHPEIANYFGAGIPAQILTLDKDEE